MSIDLKPFCATRGDHRRVLHQPFLIDGYTCATDGYILVCVPGGEPSPDQSLPDTLPGAIRKHFSKEFTDYQPLPEVDAPPQCPDCGGTGRLNAAPCFDCDGLGRFRYGEHDYDCKACDGTGVVRDVECTNLLCREGVLSRPVGVGSAIFDARHLYLVAQLPGACISVPSSHYPAVFVFNGGEGRLVPMRAVPLVDLLLR